MPVNDGSAPHYYYQLQPGDRVVEHPEWGGEGREIVRADGTSVYPSPEDVIVPADAKVYVPQPGDQVIPGINGMIIQHADGSVTDAGIDSYIVRPQDVYVPAGETPPPLPNYGPDFTPDSSTSQPAPGGLLDGAVDLLSGAIPGNIEPNFAEATRIPGPENDPNTYWQLPDGSVASTLIGTLPEGESLGGELDPRLTTTQDDLGVIKVPEDGAMNTIYHYPPDGSGTPNPDPYYDDPSTPEITGGVKDQGTWGDQPSVPTTSNESFNDASTAPTSSTLALEDDGSSGIIAPLPQDQGTADPDIVY